jgi:acetyl-CoA carboxylase biotin carboxylase subunit
MFKKILIANRGEIAIGESAPLASYLNMEAIIDAARKTDAEAIHPGYGFLAENSEFAKKCEAAKIVFIGPSAKALALVGDKVASRITARRIKAPIIPGMEMVGKDIADFKTKANEVGYPIIIKASMGGGGKGMRVVRDEKELTASIEAGRREALSAFGDESVYVEKYIEKPRHIEFQVLRDHFGNVIHLCERECSIQRRHQKIIEETPSPILDPELRSKMGDTAKKIIAAADYTNAGTVEFLLDAGKNFYFLEVNARVQVEHPITEMVVGIDLVRMQIMIAAGEKISLSQEAINQRGHAIEARIYAEDPENNFLPSPGRILCLAEPSGPGIRVDSGIYQGWNVPPQYDPILSKLIVWAENREAAIARMKRGLKGYIILGIMTNLPFLQRIMEADRFAAGDYHTHFIEEHENELRQVGAIDIALVAAGLHQATKGLLARSPAKSGIVGPKTTPWQEIGGWSLGQH